MTDEAASLAEQLEAAADALVADPAAAVSANVGNLLRYLGYHDGDPAAAPGRSRMLRAAAVMCRLFRLPVPDAPGLVFFGGEADPSVLGPHAAGVPLGNLAGSGLEPSRAFEACVGEGIEYLSSVAHPADVLETAPLSSDSVRIDQPARGFVKAVFAASYVAVERPVDWVRVRRLSDDAPFWFPADLCLRRSRNRQDFTPPLKLSTGCAAGRTEEEASLRGLLELMERDAAALWWRGGRRGRAVPANSEAGHAAALLLAQLRAGRTERTTWLLDITTDLEVPAMAALSTNADGTGFAFGLAARISLADAARAAVFELCQVELGQHVIAAKRQEAGERGLNDGDRRQLRRATFDTRGCLLLSPESGSASAPDPLPAGPEAIRIIVRRLRQHGIETYALSLTRPQFDIPVVRILAPGLQLDPCEIVGNRLARTIRETGGGATHTGGMSLL